MEHEFCKLLLWQALALARSGIPLPAEEGVKWQEVETFSDGGGQTLLDMSGPSPVMASSQTIADRKKLWQAVFATTKLRIRPAHFYRIMHLSFICIHMVHY